MLLLLLTPNEFQREAHRRDITLPFNTTQVLQVFASNQNGDSMLDNWGSLFILLSADTPSASAATWGICNGLRWKTSGAKMVSN